MVFVRERNLNLWLLLFVLLAAALCRCVQDDDFQDEPVRGVVHLRLEGEPERTVGLAQTEFIVVIAQSEDGEPAAGVWVSAVFEGAARNSVLQPSRVLTGEDGRASVSLLASDAPTSFFVRVFAPSAQEVVRVGLWVDPQQLGFRVNVSYAGARQLSFVRLSMYESLSCADAIWGEPTAQKALSLPPPAELWLPGGKEGKVYALIAQGLDATGTAKASRCLSGQKPGLSSVPLILQDVALNLAGLYSTETQIDGQAVTAAASYLESLLNVVFVDQWMKAVLDGMYDAIKESDESAAAQFAQLRIQEAFDGVVLPEYAQQRDIDLRQASHSLFSALRAVVSHLVLRGRLEIVFQSAFVSQFSHTIESLALDGGDEPWLLSVSPVATGEALLLSSTLGVNLFDVTSHRLNIGLGTALRGGLEATAKATGAGSSAGIAAALQSLIDCGALGDYLVDYVVDVATSETLTRGCATTLEGVEADLLLVTKVMDNDSAISLRGGLMAQDAPGPIAAASLRGGHWKANWSGTAIVSTGSGAPATEPVQLGPMPATFGAQREGDAPSGADGH